MNTALAPSSSAPTASAVSATTPDVFARIHEPDCNLAIWTRSPLDGLSVLFDGAPSNVRFTSGLNTFAQNLPVQLSANGFAASGALDWLIDDICQLAEHFCEVMQIEALEMRLEIVTSDSCRKFHADYVEARLISTYVGTGTQWLTVEDAGRVRDGLDPLATNTMSAGDVGLFKGKLATQTPAIHRSPPIAGTGEKRLLLVLNPHERG